MKSFLTGIATYVLAIGCHAAAVTYELPFIGTWPDYASTDLSQTFSGDGYIGMYETAQNGADQFVALLGLELTNYSRTNLQVDISALAGKSITSAILSFEILDGDSGTQPTQIVAYGGNGALGYQWDAPSTNYGSVVRDAVGGNNALDITALVAAGAASGNSWLNLHLQGTDDSVYLWTYAGSSEPVDRAQVRLVVVYGDAATEPVPVPGLGSLALVLLAVAMGVTGTYRLPRS